MRYTLATLNCIFLLGILAWPFVAFFSIFLFDAPGSTSSPITIGLAVSILAYPAPLLWWNTHFWKKWKTEATTKLAKYTVLSSTGYLFVLLFLTLLDLVCAGKYACN